jgi:uncharacterized RDD family membrane protein YckC
MIDQYVRDFERWTAATPQRRARLSAELQAHLENAREEGELEAALSRLGPPRVAARAFSEGYEQRLAPLGRRFLASAADVFPFLILYLGFWWAQDWSIFVVGPFPRGISDAVRIAFLSAAFAWWGILLSVLEWRTGQTPGKRLAELRVASEDGTALSFGQVLLRRAPLVLFPLAALDVPFVLAGRRQRAFERIARTRVVDDACVGEIRLPPEES